MTLNELKEKIENIDVTHDYDENICDIVNLLIDYDNEHHEYIFEDLYYRFESAEILFEDIKNAPDLHEVGSIIRYVDSFDEDFYLYDETYGWQNFTEDDLKEWINDIIFKIELEQG